MTAAHVKLVGTAEQAAAPQPPVVAERGAEATLAAAPRLNTPAAVPAVAAGGALQRLQNAGSRALAEAGYRLRRIGTTGLTGLALLVAAAVLFLANNLPQSAAVHALTAQLVRLAPLAKPALIAPGAGTVLAELPQREDVPAVVGIVLQQADAAGVELARGEYEYLPARDGIAAHYRMTFPVRTTYPKLRDFMDRTLAALPAVAVEGLRVERKNVGDDTVDAELKLSAYVRSVP